MSTKTEKTAYAHLHRPTTIIDIVHITLKMHFCLMNQVLVLCIERAIADHHRSSQITSHLIWLIFNVKWLIHMAIM